MTTLFARNDNNDIFATDTNRLALVSGLEAVLQHCEHAVKAQRGEMVYARDRGVDYQNHVFSGTPNLLQFEAQVRSAVRRVPNVASILAYSADIVDNRLQYAITIQTTFGTGEISGDL